ncbi:hypothetical protein MXG70_004491 [Salmonella enterica]|nr:hypothetical protein [Salmonella enterica]EJB9345404.1 hypothetical protein [Salmonella enterica]
MKNLLALVMGIILGAAIIKWIDYDRKGYIFSSSIFGEIVKMQSKDCKLQQMKFGNDELEMFYLCNDSTLTKGGKFDSRGKKL